MQQWKKSNCAQYSFSQRKTHQSNGQINKVLAASITPH
jgi:hypothetical protein